MLAAELPVLSDAKPFFSNKITLPIPFFDKKWATLAPKIPPPIITASAV